MGAGDTLRSLSTREGNSTQQYPAVLIPKDSITPTYLAVDPHGSERLSVILNLTSNHKIVK
jgi:hypothetical protein